MADAPQRSRAMPDAPLAYTVRIERRASAGDAYGNKRGAFGTVATRKAAIMPRRGGESIVGERLAARVPCIVQLREDTITRAISNGDRLVVTSPGPWLNVVFNVETNIAMKRGYRDLDAVAGAVT